MKLLFRSTLRHMRQHALQTALTFLVTVLITGCLATVFHCASSFQNLLREYALETMGDFHYRYFTDRNSETADILLEMAAAFRQDSWFEKVSLTEEGDTLFLELTAASPGIFTSRTMEKKLDAVIENYRASRNSYNTMVIMPSSWHNSALLASYGDLNPNNGSYVFLLVFFLMVAIIAVMAVLTLGAVFQVSASQREREFALFSSVGADGSHIRSMVLMESACYICFALPTGYLLGILFFQAVRGAIDDLLLSADGVPPIHLVISVPYSLVLFLCAALIILGSGFLPAAKAALISPIELLHRNKELRLTARERDHSDPAAPRTLGVEGWLAKKTYKRFKRRRRPILAAMSVAFALCLVLAAFRSFTTDAIDMAYRGNNYSTDMSLDSDDGEVQMMEESLLQRAQVSIAGFEFLCTALIFLLMLICICGNFAVSWTVNNTRQREFATLMSIGMKPGELRKMKGLELLFNLTLAFVPGFIAGMVCHGLIFRAYSVRFQMQWSFPWAGLLLGVALLCLSTVLTELAVKLSGRSRSMADMLRSEE